VTRATARVRPPHPAVAERRRARDRQRQCRARRRAGEAQFTIAVPEVALVEALIVSGRVGESESADHALVEKALAAVVRDFVERWVTA
jgi:hypothetical protein